MWYSICTINYEPGKAGCLYLQYIKNIKTVQNATKAKNWQWLGLNLLVSKARLSTGGKQLKCLSDFKCTRFYVAVLAEVEHGS